LSRIIGRLICVLGTVALCIGAHPAIVLAERYHDAELDSTLGESSICITNHLNSSCWQREGSMMYYTEEGFTSSVGVDVSKWNGDIDWDELKAQGVEFVIIRLGCRGYEYGDLVLDDRFHEYMQGAANAGLQIGVYFYSQAIDEDEAREEAQFVIDNLAGYSIDLPVYFDTEEVAEATARTEVMAEANFTFNARAFCETIEASGYRAGVYASSAWIRRNLDLTQLADYEIWYASYGDVPGGEYGFDMWQYTESGDLSGCSTYLDMNVRVSKVGA
jgi:GH25 family lysozyme M1 (1,4-beta-N-acetylmuramidase)